MSLSLVRTALARSAPSLVAPVLCASSRHVATHAKPWHDIMGIFVHDRTEEAKKVQSLLTAHSDNVRTRLGLKCRDGYKCGLILIELEGDLAGRKALQQELEKLDGVETKKMEFFTDPKF